MYVYIHINTLYIYIYIYVYIYIYTICVYIYIYIYIYIHTHVCVYACLPCNLAVLIIRLFVLLTFDLLMSQDNGPPYYNVRGIN